MRFSVVIPVYNKASTIKDSVKSILAQKTNDFEIIIVDDGSKDELEKALAEFSDIKVIHQENSGVSVARNTGIKAATGDFICFLDADDTWFDCHLEVLSKLIEENPGINYFITSHRTLYPDGRAYDTCKKLEALQNDTVITDNLFKYINDFGDGIIHTNCICVHRESLIKHNILFEPGEKIGEDTDMWYRIALQETVVLSKAVTTLYRREYSTATQNSSNTQDWVFARRLPDILASNEISDEVKHECIRLIDRYLLTCCRDLARKGSRKAACMKLKNIKNKSGKRYTLTYILCHMPKKLCRFVLNRRSS